MIEILCLLHKTLVVNIPNNYSVILYFVEPSTRHIEVWQMVFNSIDFAIFLPITFFLYWFLTNKNLKIQNILVVTASYIFYGWWDWRFLTLIVFSTFTDFFTGILLSKQENIKIRKVILAISIFINLSFLGFFKYYNFFVNNFVAAFSFFGIKFNFSHLSVDVKQCLILMI